MVQKKIFLHLASFLSKSRVIDKETIEILAEIRSRIKLRKLKEKVK